MQISVPGPKKNTQSTRSLFQWHYEFVYLIVDLNIYKNELSFDPMDSSMGGYSMIKSSYIFQSYPLDLLGAHDLLIVLFYGKQIACQNMSQN